MRSRISSAALLNGTSCSIRFFILAAGTDGSDGPTNAAGAIVDGESAPRARGRGLDPLARLAENDSNPVLALSNDLVVTGPTNTNLLDLYMVLVGAPSS